MPTITIDNVNGSDTAASGCGPAAAVYGTGCHGVSGSPRLSLDDAGSLSSVSAGDVIYVASAGANRRYSRIVAKQDDAASTTGSSTAGDPAITGVASAAGIAVGDIVRVGTAVPVWAAVGSITGSGPYTLGLSAAPGSTETGVAVTRARQVTCEDNWTSPGSAWAIGGRRRDLASAETQRLFADARAGWIIDILETGTDYDIGSAAIAVTCAGDLSAGRVTVTSSSSARPVVKTTGTGHLFELTAAHYLTIRRLGLRSTNAAAGHGVRCTGSVSSAPLIEDCVFEGLGCGVYLYVAQQNVVVRGCVFRDCKVGIGCSNSIADTSVIAEGNLFHTTQSTPASYYGIKTGTYGLAVRALGNVFHNLECGILSAASSARTDDWQIEGNTFHTLLADGVRQVATAGYARGLYRNNLFWSCAYGIAYTNGAAAANDAWCRLNHGNAFGACSSGAVLGLAASSGAVTLTGDPCAAAASLDFRLNGTAGAGAACRGAGHPAGVGIAVVSANALDIGALQHQAAGGGVSLARVAGGLT